MWPPCSYAIAGFVMGMVLAVLPPHPPALASSPSDCRNGYVALTFDDGPSPSLTPQILDILRRHDAVGTFFPNGVKVDFHPTIMDRAWNEGHVLANHGWDHHYLTSLSDAQIRSSLQRTYDALAAAGAEPIGLYRPPYGATSDRVRSAAASIGFAEIMWTVDPQDYGNSAATVRDHVLSRLRNGAVILFHDGTATSTVTALDSILRGIHSRGFCTGHLDAKGRVVPPRPPTLNSGVQMCPVGASCDTVAFQTISGSFEVWRSPSTGVVDHSFYFGNPGDIAFSGDWNCNGERTAGLYRALTGYAYLRMTNTQGVADVAFYFGNPGDLPLAGDWNGDGCDTLSLYRPSQSRVYVINRLGSSSTGLGAADYSFAFGNPGDRPFSGDFDGDGVDTVGLFRPSTGMIYLRNSNRSEPADRSFAFGSGYDVVLAGDWNGDGIDTVAAYRPLNGVLHLSADAWAWAGRRAGVIVIGP